MTIKDFIYEIQNVVANAETDISGYDLKIDFDYCEIPYKINYSINHFEHTIIITIGMRGF
jgi:hypothetical protein